MKKKKTTINEINIDYFTLNVFSAMWITYEPDPVIRSDF